MEAYFETLYQRFHELHAEIEKSLDALPAEALDWVPGPEMNSPSVIMVHLTENTRFFIGDLVMGDPSKFDREAGFRVKGLSKPDLVSRLSDTNSYLQTAFEKLRLADLDRLITQPRTGNQSFAAYYIFLALSHTATHLGHLQVTVQLWQQRIEKQG